MSKAFDDILIGGNHLANFLIFRLGAGFSSKMPPTMDIWEARDLIPEHEALLWDVWCCWAAIMRARSELDASAGSDVPPAEATNPSVQCAGQERLHAEQQAVARRRAELEDATGPTHIMCIGWETIRRLAKGESVWFDDLQCGAVAADDLFGVDIDSIARAYDLAREHHNHRQYSFPHAVYDLDEIASALQWVAK